MKLILLCLLAACFWAAERFQIPLPATQAAPPAARQAFDLPLASPTSLEICWRTASGPGVVSWHLPEVQTSGYSALTEDRDLLTWASPSLVAVDAIYRRDWGCGLALKIPDSCSVEVYPNRIVACCNAVAAQLGNVPHWVKPGIGHEVDWPRCPLP